MFLLPPSVDAFVPADSPTRILSEIIDRLDCRALYQRYAGGGAPAYDPKMMLKVLVFGYSQGIRSSRKLARALEHDLRFMFLSGMSRPDFHTLCRFRKENQGFLQDLFCQTVSLARSCGLVLLEHVAVDGTKLEANAARRNVVDREEMVRQLKRVEEAVARILEEADAADEAEDAELKGARGDEVPEELKDLEARKERLDEALRELQESGRKTLVTTDRESRLMKTHGGYRAAYNAQAAVDKEHQIIVAAEVTQQEGDTSQLEPMLDQVEANCEALPQTTSADSGYWSQQSLDYVKRRQTDAYIPAPSKTRSQRHALDGWVYDPQRDVFRSEAGREMGFSRERIKDGRRYRVYRTRSQGLKEVWVRQEDAWVLALRSKLATPEGKAVYRLRQQTVEPVFGRMKEVLGLRRLLLRGLKGARIEYLLACSAHNLFKISRQWRDLPNKSLQTA
jgi:transposase